MDYNKYECEKINLAIEDSSLISAEYIAVEEEGEVKGREQSWLNGGEDEEE